jgi:DNA-binding transcriptional MocR family regulator
VTKPEAGMHTIGWLCPGAGDREISRLAADAGVVTWALSSWDRHGADVPQAGLILGFAAYSVAEISDAVRTLARVVRESQERAARRAR